MEAGEQWARLTDYYRARPHKLASALLISFFCTRAFLFLFFSFSKARPLCARRTRLLVDLPYDPGVGGFSVILDLGGESRVWRHGSIDRITISGLWKFFIRIKNPRNGICTYIYICSFIYLFTYSIVYLPRRAKKRDPVGRRVASVLYRRNVTSKVRCALLWSLSESFHAIMKFLGMENRTFFRAVRKID